MFSFNRSIYSPADTTGIIIEKHLTVQTASEITGYNAQYLRRLLRARKLEAIKVGQIWLISLASLQAYLSCAINSDDMRFGPRWPGQLPF